MRKTQYHATKLRPLVQIIARTVAENPELAHDPELLMARLAEQIPGFNDHKKCVNCEASMAEYDREFDIFAALLLLNMGRIVKKRVAEGVPFTEANKVHISKEQDIPFSSKLYANITSKLGLIAKLRGEDGKQSHALWVVTTRGWAALRGEQVPRSVRVFRNQILERKEEMTTLAEVFKRYRERKKSLGAAPDDYNPNEWVRVGGYADGKLL